MKRTNREQAIADLKSIHCATASQARAAYRAGRGGVMGNDYNSYTGLKYDADCGWYAIRNGRIICPEQGISGKKVDAEMALIWASIDWHAVEPLPEDERCVPEDPAYLSIPF